MIEKQNPGWGWGGCGTPCRPAPGHSDSGAGCSALGKGNGGGAGPTGLPVFRHYGRIDTASHVEFRQKAHESRGGRRHQVAQYFVGHGLMKGAAAAKGPDIEL